MTAPFPSLGSYLSFLEAAGRLRRVRAEVDKDTELACIARWAMESWRDEDAYAMVFEKILGHSVPVAVHLYATRAMFASALGVSEDGLLDRWSAAMAEPRPPALVAEAAVHRHVDIGDEVDCEKIPAPVWTPGRDAGPYLSAAVVITKDPSTGVQNMASYRVQMHDRRTLGLFFGSRLQHGAQHLAKYRERGEKMPVALAIGVAPAVNFAAAAKTAYGVDEMTIACGLAQAPLTVARGKTVDLLVPAEAEYVIEGFVPPDAMREEGPFGEALGYMNHAAPASYIEVTAICHREGAVHHGYVQQLPPSDGHLVMEMGILGPLWYYLTRKLRIKGLRDLAIAPGSAGVAALAVQLNQEGTKQAGAIGRALAKMNFGQKFVYLVDEDIDIRDAQTMNWALSARVDPERDVRIVPDTSTFQYDPSILARAHAEGTVLGAPPYRSSMMIVDATVKCGVPELALPRAEQMNAVLRNWSRWGLPEITERPRLRRLLDQHEGDEPRSP